MAVRTVFSIIDDASATLSGIGNSLQGVARKISSVSQSLFFWKEAVGTIKGVFASAYDYLIQRNEQMNQQILSSQASLVAVSNVFKNGFQIENATTAIQSLAPKIKATLDQIQKDSLTLVGVTSQQLNEPFQILLTNAQQISGQSKTFKDSIAAAGKLVPAFAATLGTLQIPLFQANQEITSIAQSTIDMNSKLAKSLGITNDMVNSWKGQGVFVDKLLEKMDSFVKGNALAANSIGGISSNIQEVLELVTRRVGADLMQPFINSLNYVYTALQDRQKDIEDTLGQVIGFVVDLGGKISEAFQPLMPVLSSLAEAAGKILGAGLEVIGRQLMVMAEGFKIITNVSAPFLQSLGTILNLIGDFANSPIGQILLQLKLAEISFQSINPLLGTFGNTLAAIFPQLSRLQNLDLSTIAKSIQSFSSLGSTSIDLDKFAIGFAQNIGKAFGDLRGKITTLIPDLTGKLPDLQPFFDGFVNGVGKVSSAIESIKSKIIDVSNSVSSAIANPDKAIKDFGIKLELMGSNLVGFASQLPTKLNDSFNAVKDAVNKLPSSLSDLKSNLDRTFNEAFAKLPQNIQNALVSVKDTITKSQVWQGLTDSISPVFQQIKTQFSSLYASIQDRMNSIQTSQGFQKFASGVSNAFQSIGQQVSNIGINAQAFGGKLTGAIGIVNNAVAGLTSKYSALGNVLAGLKPSPALLEMAGGIATAGLLAAAISAVGLAFQTYNDLMEASSKNTKDFVKTTQLAIDKLKELELQRGKIPDNSGKSREQSRLEDIKEGQNWFQKGRDIAIEGIKKIPFLSLTGMSDKIQTGAESQLAGESSDFADLIGKNDEFLADRQKSLAALTQSYKDLKSEKARGIITEETYQTKVAALDKEFDQHVNVVNSAIEKMRSLKAPTDAAAVAQAQMVKELERFKNKITDLNNVEIRPKDLPELGNTLQQLAKSAGDAMRTMGFGNEEAVKRIKSQVIALKDELTQAEQAGDTARVETLKAKIQALDKDLAQLGGTGDPVQYKKAAEELISVTKTQVEQGGITLKEAESRYKRLSQLTTLDKDTQIKALAELRAVRKKDEDDRQKDLDIRQQQIESFAQAGFISEAKAQKQINELKLKGAQDKLEDLRQQILEEEAAGRGGSEFAKQLKQQEKQTQIEITKIEADGIKQRREQRLKDYDEQTQILESRKKRNLMSEASYQAELLKIQKGKAQETLNQVKDKRSKLDPGDKEGQEALNAEEAKALGDVASAEEEYRKNRREAQLKMYDDDQKILDSKYKNRLMSELEYAKQSLEITRKRGAAEIKQIEEDIARTPKSDIEKLKALEARRAEILGNIASKEKEVQDKANEERLKSYDNQESILKASYDRRLMSETEYLQKSLAISKAKLVEELKQIEAARKKLAPGDKAGAEALDVRQAEALAKVAKQEEDLRQKQNQLRLQHYDNLQKGLDYALAKNLVSEDEYSKKSLAIVKQKGTEELKQIASDKAKLAASDKDGREALEAKATEVRKRIADAEKKERERVRAERLKDYDEQTQILESSYKRRLVTTAKYQADLLKLEEGRGNEKLKQISDRRKELAPNDKQGQEALNAEESKALGEIEDAREKYRQNRRQAELKSYDDDRKILDAKLKHRLITEVDYAKQSLEIVKKRGAAEIRQIEEDIARTPKGDTEKLKDLGARRAEILAGIAAREKEITDKANEEKLAVFDRTEAILKANYERRFITESDYLKKSLANNKAKLAEELRQIEESRKKLLPTDTSGRQALDVKEAEARAKFFKQSEELRQKELQLQLQHYDNQQKNLDAYLGQNLISEREYAQKSLDNTRAKAAEELKQIEIDRKRLLSTDTTGREALEVKENEVRKRLYEAEKQFRDKQNKLRLEDFDEQQTMLDRALSTREITQVEYANRSIKLLKEKTAEQLRQLDDEQSRLAKGDKDGAERIATQRIKILEGQKAAELALQKRASEEIMREIEVTQSKALDKLTELDIERQMRLDALVRQGRTSRNLAREEELKAAKERLNVELQGEQQRLSALQSIDPYSDPKAEEERQKNIRQSRIKTLQITQQLLKNQFDTEDYYIELVYKRRKEAIDREIYDRQRSLEDRMRAEDFISQAIERQVKSREQLNSLDKAIFNASQQEYSIAASLTDNEDEKKQIEIEAAKARIESIKLELTFQQQSLEIEKQKLESARERKKIELEMQSVTQVGETEKLQADLQNLIDTGADKLEIIRKEREIESSQRKEAYIQYQLYLNDQQKSLDEREVAFKQRMLSIEYATKEDAAIADLAKKTDSTLDDIETKNRALTLARNLNATGGIGMGSAVGSWYEGLPQSPQMKSFQEWSESVKDNTKATQAQTDKQNKDTEVTSELIDTFKNPPKPYQLGSNAGDIIKLSNNSNELVGEINEGYTSLVGQQGKGIDTLNSSVIRMNQDLVDSMFSLQANDQNNTAGLMSALLAAVSQGTGDNQLNNYFTNNFYGSDPRTTANNAARQIQDQSLATLNKFVKEITRR